jgi:hypothetical protein
MANPIIPPFSARNRGAHAHIDSDFPETARVGLIHLLHDLIRRRYILNWGDVAREAERISREPVRNYDGAEGTARSNSETFLKKLPWEKVLDFCERLYNSLPNEMPRSAEAKRYRLCARLKLLRVLFFLIRQAKRWVTSQRHLPAMMLASYLSLLRRPFMAFTAFGAVAKE